MRPAATSTTRIGLATGQMLGIVAMFALFAFLSIKWVSDLPDMGIRKRRGQVEKDLKKLERELTEHFKQHGKLPGIEGMAMLTTRRADVANLGGMGSYTWHPKEFTPAAPLLDPFSLEKKMPYGYFGWEGGFVVSSAGPNEKYDLKPKTIFNARFDPQDKRLADATYDPTNGTASAGDLMRIHLFDKK